MVDDREVELEKELKPTGLNAPESQSFGPG